MLARMLTRPVLTFALLAALAVPVALAVPAAGQESDIDDPEVLQARTMELVFSEPTTADC